MSSDGILTITVTGVAMDPRFRARVRFESAPVAQTIGDAGWRLTLGPAVTQVDITVIVLAADLKTTLEALEQRLVVTTVAGARVLTPGTCKSHGHGWKSGAATTPSDVEWSTRLHPRLAWASSDTHEFSGLTVDLGFVVVTEYLMTALGGALQREYSGPPRDVWPHHGCVLHALECTALSGPRTWFVLVPPALDTAPTNPLKGSDWKPRDASRLAPHSVDMLIYLRSRVFKDGRMQTYDTIEKTPISGWMERLYRKPPAAAPFFAQPGAGWDSFPPIGFERQLAGSGKAVLVVQPWPSGLDYGLLYQGNLRPLLDGLARCLASRGSIARASLFDIRCGRIGVAGFSGGGNEAIKIWRAGRRDIDELYFFDPQSFRQDQGHKDRWLLIDASGAVAPDLREWYRDARRRLRFIGGLQHADALFIANTLEPEWRKLLAAAELGQGPPPRTWVKPSSFEFRAGVGDGEIYSRAFLVPPSVATGQNDPLAAHRLSAAGAPASALTRATGLEWIEKGDQPLKTTVRILALGRNETLDCSHAEVAGFLETLWMPQGVRRFPQAMWQEREARADAVVRDEGSWKSLRRLLAWYVMYGQTQEAFDADDRKGFLIHRAYSVRHQWTTPGGEGEANRGAGFRGYWEYCLRHSGFETPKA